MRRQNCLFNATFDLKTLNGTNGFIIPGLNVGNNLGYSVGSAGDINGDGIGDAVIGGNAVGYVIFGQINGFPAKNFNLTALNGSNGFVIQTLNTGGVSINTAGDINGDELDDVVIGNADKSYVIYGQKKGFLSPFYLANLNGTNGFTIPGLNAGDQLGYSVSTAGDLNGDQIDDLVLGAVGVEGYLGNVLVNNVGNIYVLLGQKGGFPSSFDVATLKGSNGFNMVGGAGEGGYENFYGSYLGSSVSTAGDMNGDGIDDLLMGANWNRVSAGQSFVLFGQASSFPPTVSISGTNGFEVTGTTFPPGDQGDDLGFSVSSAGDINDDGLTDIVLGAPADEGYLMSSKVTGESYIIFGRKSGFPSTGFSTGQGLLLPQGYGFSISGLNVQDRLGSAVSTAGDINGDGVADVVLGAPGVNSNGGESYVIFGQKSSFPSSFNLSTLNGCNGFTVPALQAGDALGSSVSVAGDVNDDGISDLVLGAPGASGGAGASYVIFGRSACTPTLQINKLLALQGRAVVLTSSNLAATDSCTPSPELLFVAINVQNGQFEYVNNPMVPIVQFFQSNVSMSAVQFRTQDTPSAPAYMITVINQRGVKATGAAAITFHDAPVLRRNQLKVVNGTSVTLSSQDLNATETYTPAEDLLFTVSDIEHGQFQLVNNTLAGFLQSNLTQFFQQNITNGAIEFIHDGSNHAPSYEVLVSDEILNSGAPSLANITFHDAPVLVNNQLTIKQGQAVVLSAGYLSATEHYTPAGELVFKVNNVHHGKFQNLELVADKAFSLGITEFSQQNVTNKIIQFVDDGSSKPARYDVLVTDGLLTNGGYKAANVTFKKDTSGTSIIAVIGGWWGVAGIIGGGLFLFFLAALMSGLGMWYYKRSKAPKIRIFREDSSANLSDSSGEFGEKQPLLSVNSDTFFKENKLGAQDKGMGEERQVKDVVEKTSKTSAVRERRCSL